MTRIQKELASIKVGALLLGSKYTESDCSVWRWLWLPPKVKRGSGHDVTYTPLSLSLSAFVMKHIIPTQTFNDRGTRIACLGLKRTVLDVL